LEAGSLGHSLLMRSRRLLFALGVVLLGLGCPEADDDDFVESPPDDDDAVDDDDEADDEADDDDAADDDDISDAVEVGSLRFADGLPRNLILVAIDTLRRDALGTYNGSDASPFLDGKLAEAVRLDTLHSCSNFTAPAFYCLFGGRNPLDVGFWPVPWTVEDNYIGDRSDFVWGSAVLGDAGFITAAAETNALLELAYPDFGESFQHYAFDYGDSAWVTDTVLDFADGEVVPALSTDPNQPFFLVAHYFDPHPPYRAPAEYLTGVDELEPVDVDFTFSFFPPLAEEWPSLSPEERALVLEHLTLQYRSEVRYLDAQIERLWAGLEERSLLEDTLVVLWSDHGEQFFEHGGSYHGADLFHEETAALGAFLAPGLESAVVTDPVVLMDLWPTIVAALGLSEQPDLSAHLEGAPGAVVGLADPGRDRFAWGGERGGAYETVIRRGDKTLHYQFDGEVFFADRTEDPQELVDRFDATDPEVQSMWEALQPEIARIQTLFTDQAPVTPPGL